MALELTVLRCHSIREARQFRRHARCHESEWPHRILQSCSARTQYRPDPLLLRMDLRQCLNALEEFDILLDFAETQDVRNKFGVPHAVAPLIANAAWSVGRPDAMQDSISYMRQPEKAWYAAVLATMTDDYAAASSNVEQARDLLCQELGQSKKV